MAPKPIKKVIKEDESTNIIWSWEFVVAAILGVMLGFYFLNNFGSIDRNLSKIRSELVEVKSNIAYINDNTLYNNGKINKIYNIVEESQFDYLQCSKSDSNTSEYNCIRKYDDSAIWKDTPNGVKMYYSDEFLKKSNSAKSEYDCPDSDSCPISVAWSYSILR